LTPPLSLRWPRRLPLLLLRRPVRILILRRGRECHSRGQRDRDQHFTELESQFHITYFF